MYMPRGANVWKCVGGALAVTDQVEAVWMLEHTTVSIAHQKAGGKGKKPEMRKFPLGWDELEAKTDYTLTQAEAFRAKQAERAARNKNG